MVQADQANRAVPADPEGDQGNLAGPAQDQVIPAPATDQAVPVDPAGRNDPVNSGCGLPTINN